MRATRDNLQRIFLYALGAVMRVRWWMWGFVLLGVMWIVLARINGAASISNGPAKVNIAWGPTTGFCTASYVEIQNNSFQALTTDDWWFGDGRATYHFSHQWLLPGASVRLWPGSGTNDALNVYAGGTVPDWRQSSAWIDGPPERLFIRLSCDPT